MKNNIQIIPAILPQNFGELAGKLNLLKEAYEILGEKDKLMVQIDICDDELFENFDFIILEKYSDIFEFELDLMNINMSKIGERLNDLSHSVFSRIIFHYEDNYVEMLFPIGNSISKGLAFLPSTTIKEIQTYLEKVDFVQFMGIDKVGAQGSSFNPEVIEKIKEFRKENPEMIISVDGGVNLKNAQDLIDAGVNRLVSGSGIFGENNSAQEIAENIKKFNNVN